MSFSVEVVHLIASRTFGDVLYERELLMFLVSLWWPSSQFLDILLLSVLRPSRFNFISRGKSLTGGNAGNNERALLSQVLGITWHCSALNIVAHCVCCNSKMTVIMHHRDLFIITSMF